MQVAEQSHRVPLLQRCPPSNWILEYRSNRAHEIVVVAGDAPHGYPHVTQESHAGKAGKRGTPWAGGEENKWMDSVAEDRQIFGISGDWSTAAALDAGVWYNTVWYGHHI